MDTIDRLKRLTGEKADRFQESPSMKPGLDELRRKIDAIMARKPLRPAVHSAAYAKDSIPLEAVLSGEIVVNPHGKFFFCRSRFRGHTFHGNLRISECLDVDMPSASMLAGSSAISGLGPYDALFFDTETTGLAGGTGTFPFLVGLGWFEGEDFITCQLFARDFSDEKAILSFLNETACGKRFLVSFNGRAFDLNLLSARFVLNRLENRLMDMPHLDLLNPSRRLFSHRTANCRLVTLEDEVLGFRRTGDVPGSEIPQRYFDWLRSRDPGFIEDVFEHNRLDIVSMAALLRRLTWIASGNCIEAAHPGDVLASARMHWERGNSDTVQHMMERLACCSMPEYSIEARKMLSLVHKRRGCWNEAVRLWEELATADSQEAFALVELAKYHEHRAHDMHRALSLVEKALEYPSLPELEQTSLLYRRARLLKKIGDMGNVGP